MELYPLLMAPGYRHGSETPWGGTMLRDVFMKKTPNDITGECLEVSVLEGHESMVANGPHAGKPLSRIAELWGKALTGVETGEFPLLLKLLDVQTPLSVQVNPGDDYARAHEGKPGRNSAWVILNAEIDSKIVYGMETKGEDLKKIIDEGRVEECLHWEHVLPGDVFYIPAGFVHAIGENIQCYEIQQTCEVAYRMYDWNRVDAQGNTRELHIEKALDVAEPDRVLHKNEGTTVLCKGGSVTYYISDRRFELCRLNLSGKMPLESGRMLLLTAVNPCEIHWGDEMLELNVFDTVLVPADMDGVWLEGDAKILMSSLPRQEKLREELGYRAENVAGLMD